MNAFRFLLALSLGVAINAAALADSPAPTASGHPYDPCALVSQTDIASAAGVAVNQVSTPQRPTTNECVWAVGGKAGVPGQQFALTVQTVGQVQHTKGIAQFGAILSAVQEIPGVPMSSHPVVTHAFADAHVVVGLGDKAGWKNGTLSVLKSETLYQVNATGQGSDSASLAAAKRRCRRCVAARSHAIGIARPAQRLRGRRRNGIPIG